MRKLFFSLLVLGGMWIGLGRAATPVRAAEPQPPAEIVAYTIEVQYDPETHQLTGREVASYTNRTSEPIPDLVFHLYLNAFRSEDTMWIQESGPGHRGFSANLNENGWMEVHSLRLADGKEIPMQPLDADNTLMRAALPRPVAPGETIQVEMRFTSQMPKVFARTGWADEGRFVMAGQWFPKFGVWQDGEWNAYPFHANSEFYSDFGSYDVALTLPDGWTVGSTGAPIAAPQVNGDGTTLHRLHAENVIDFAWAASSRFEVLQQDVDGVAVRLLHSSDQKNLAERAMKAVAEGMRAYTRWYGPYGMGLYPNLTVIMVPPDGGGAGGMEYPMLFTVGMDAGMVPDCVLALEVETVHELGHQWFQSVVATNEAEEPWLDEGLTDYITTRAMDTLYDGAMSVCGGWNFKYRETHRLSYAYLNSMGAASGMPITGTDGTPGMPMAGKAWDFGMLDYTVAVYAKPALSLSTLEDLVGEEAMLKFMSTYYQRYAFSHPTAADLRAVMEETLGAERAEWFFTELVEGEGMIDARVNELKGERAELERLGGLCVPLEVRVTYRWGQSERVDWPCEEQTLVVTGREPIQMVEIDPEHKVKLDVNLVNNGRRAGYDLGVWLSMAVRTVHLLQNFFLWGGAAW